jgi:3-oxoacyl-[acyl-carrier protein] reductase
MTKFAFITGGGGSVGRGLCVEFAKQGYDIGIVGRTASKLEQTALAVAQAAPGRLVRFAALDIRDCQKLSAAIDDFVTHLGQLAVFVHCAAVHHWRTINNATEQAIDEELDINLRAAIQATRLVAPHMIKHQQGTIVFLTSWLTQQLGWPGTGVYLASKFGLHGLARVVFEDLRNFNIKCTSLCPGFIESHGLGHEFAMQFGDYINLPPEQMLSVCVM